MTTIYTVTIPLSLGGTNTPYSSGPGAYGMASESGHGYKRWLFPMLAEMIVANQAAVTASTASVASASAADASATLAEDWATKTSATVDGAEFSAKEYAQGAQAATGGSAKNWASQTGADVTGAAAGSRSAKSWSQDDLTTGGYGGSAKDWAKSDSLPDGAYKSARGYALETAATLTAASAIMLGYATTAQGASSQAQAYAASAASVAQQDLSGVTAAKLHSSPNAVTAMCLYDVSKDSDGGAWVERVTNTSWFQEALNGTYLPGGFASEMDARDYLGSYQAASIVTGDSSTAGSSVGSWVTQNGNGTVTAVSGRFRLTLTATVGNTAGMALPITTVVGQRYQITVDFVTANAANTFLSAGTASGNNSLASLNMTTERGTRRLSFVATGTTSYINVYGSTTWAQNSYAEVDNITVRPVTFADPAGAFGQSSADGKFYRLYKNLLANSGFQGGTSGTWGSGAVAPTGWSGPSATGSVTFSASSRYAGEQQVQYVATAQRPYLSVAYTASASTTLVFSFFVEALASGSPQILDLLNLGGAPAGTTVSYRKNGTTALGTATVAAGDFVEIVIAISTTGGAVTLRHGLGANGNATGDITLSPPQLELVNSATSLATTYESKAVGVGSQAEVFRGNKAKFPRLAAIVCEAASLTIYDLTESGRPMWMRFTGLGGGTSALRGSAAGVAVGSGSLVLAHSLGLSQVDFGQDRAFSWSSGGRLRYRGTVALRNAALGHDTDDATKTLPSNTVNAVAMCVLPDAPVDPVTGLQVPTIACFTGAGISIIQNDGTVRNSSSTAAFTGGQISKDMLFALRTSDLTALWYAAKPASLGAAFGINQIAGSAAPGFTDATGNAGFAQFVRTTVAARQGARLALMRLNETTPAQSLVAHIAPTYNTGWWCGDIRRVWCADTVTGTASSGEKVNEPSFDATGNWLTGTVGSATAASIAAGQVNLPRTDGSNYSYVYQTLTLEGNKTYTLTVVNGGAGSITALVGTAALGSTMGTLGVNAGATGVLQVTATQASVVLTIRSANDGTTGVATSASVVEGVLDRCYKAKPATIYGTLARTAVAAAAQLVFYTGWSAANYLQEAYSADLDPATGNLAVRAWGTIPTNVAAAGWALDRSAATGAYYRLGHSATGQIVGELYDGTTTRTVTTTATYATGQALEFGMEYVPNGASSTLTLKVGGRQVAQSTFAALNSLSNATAVATVGIDRALTAPWAGGLALVKVGMTAASANASAWMFELEKQMFRPGAQVTLPSASSLVDVSYDEATDTVSVVDAANEAHFVGMVRVSTAAVPAGAFSKVARGGGLKLVARTGTNPGVDVTVPAQNLREELRRGEEAARRARLSRVFDFDSVTGQADFSLPPGWEAIEVMSAGASKREGATKDWTRVYDGFVETVRFGVSPGSGAWVQVTARRAA